MFKCGICGAVKEEECRCPSEAEAMAMAKKLHAELQKLVQPSRQDIAFVWLAVKVDRLNALVKTLDEVADTLTSQRDAAGWTKCYSDECVLPNGHADFHMTVEAYRAQEPAKAGEEKRPVGYCACGHASADHFFDRPHACNYGHPCRCAGFTEPAPPSDAKEGRL